jgi:hypothetical protein
MTGASLQEEARMFYWVCVNERPVDLPTEDIEAAKQLALDHIRADISALVEIDVHSRDATLTKLLYDHDMGEWIEIDPLAP